MLTYLVEGGRLTDLSCWLIITIGGIIGLWVGCRIPDDDTRAVIKEAREITRQGGKL